MVLPTRRSARQRANPATQPTSDRQSVASRSEEENDEDSDSSSAGAGTSSADEWIPPTKKRRSGRHDGLQASLSDEDEEESEGDEDDEEATRPKKQRRSNIPSSTGKKSMKSDRVRPRSPPEQEDADLPIMDAASVLQDEEDRKEAERAWREVRERQKASKTSDKQAPSTTVANKPAGALDQWLGIQPPAWPATCDEAMINDRDSLFVGFVYSLQSASQAEITQCLSHLTKVVQPKVVPTSKMPPAMQHLKVDKRGAHHDMYAWRTLALKKGRTGLGGPEDFGLEEGQEDDGERFGAKEIAKVIRTYGATDVLVVVSRWYGGVMLGPVRFRHIENCAKAALAKYMVNEAMRESRQELQLLDRQIAELKHAIKATTAASQGPSSATATPENAQQHAINEYEDLNPERAQRLLNARRKQIETMTKLRLSKEAQDGEQTAAQELPSSSGVPESEQLPSPPLEEDEEALRLLAEVEEQERVGGQSVSQSATTDERGPEESTAASPPLAVKSEVGVDPSDARDPAADRVNVKEEAREDEHDLTGWDEL